MAADAALDLRRRSQRGFLLQQLVLTDFKLRYQGSIFGYLWSLMRPLGLFGILYVVFVSLFHFGNGVPNFPFYLLLGIVLWTFFGEATTTAIRAVTDKSDMIRKVSISKPVLVVAPVLAAFVNLLLNLVVVLVFAVASGVFPHIQVLLLPLVLLELFAISLALSFLLAALYVRYHDVTYIWELFQQGAFYATPIIYPLTLIPQQYQKWMLLNPIAQILQDARYVLIHDHTGTAFSRLPLGLALVPYLIVVATVLLAGRYFAARSRGFAEII